MDGIKTTEKNNNENAAGIDFETFAKHAQANARRINKPVIDWTDEHETELKRLLAIWQDKIQTAATEKEAALLFPSWQTGDLIAEITAAVAVLEAFKTKWAHVLTDRGAQASLFKTKTTPTKKQAAAWANYYEMDADMRRLWLLVAANLVKGTQNYLIDAANKKTSIEALGQKPFSDFEKIYNSPAVNAITRANKKACKSAEKNKITGRYTLEISGIQLAFKEQLTPPAQKFCDFLIVKLTQQNGYKRFKKGESREDTTIFPDVVFTVEEYMNIIGRENTKDNRDLTRKEIRAFLDILYEISFSGKSADGKSFIDVRLLEAKAMDRGQACVASFGHKFTRLQLDTPLGILPVWGFKLTGRHGVEYAICRELARRYSNDALRREGTHDIISVKSLMKIAADTIPNEEEAKARRIEWKRLLQRLENYLDTIGAVSGNLFRWEYCNAKKQPLTGEAADGDYIKYEFLDYPDQSERIARNAAKAAAKEKAKQRAIAKNIKKKKTGENAVIA